MFTTGTAQWLCEFEHAWMMRTDVGIYLAILDSALLFFFVGRMGTTALLLITLPTNDWLVRRMDIVKTFCPNLQALQGGNLLVDMTRKLWPRHTSTQYSTALNHFVANLAASKLFGAILLVLVVLPAMSCASLSKKQEEATLPLETPVKTSGKCGFEQSKGCTLWCLTTANCWPTTISFNGLCTTGLLDSPPLRLQAGCSDAHFLRCAISRSTASIIGLLHICWVCWTLGQKAPYQNAPAKAWSRSESHWKSGMGTEWTSTSSMKLSSWQTPSTDEFALGCVG